MSNNFDLIEETKTGKKKVPPNKKKLFRIKIRISKESKELSV